MAQELFSKKMLKNIQSLINSLRLAQRAELTDESGRNLISELYVDPLPNNAVLNQITHDDTVFLVGRKGTGKSTIFAMAQDYFRHEKKQISAYIDVKTLYGKSIAQDINVGDSNANVQKLLLFQNFITIVLTELLKELEKNLDSKNLINKILSRKKNESVRAHLSNLRKLINEPDYVDVSLKLDTGITSKGSINSAKKETSNSEFNAEITNKSIKIASANKNISEDSESLTEENIKTFSGVLLRHFSIKEYMEKISAILIEIGISKAHIFLDDFSEIDYEAQQIFVNTILAPLNNWSEKFFRFKVGAYPKRIFYGEIEKGKVSEINLDYYDLFKVKGLPELEVKAIDFLERLLDRRFDYFLQNKPEMLFQVDLQNSWESYKKILFQSSMNIPRVLGNILHYCYQSAIIYQKKITKSLIEDAAQKYYHNQIEYYFGKTNYLAEAFEELLDRYSQQQLIDNVVAKAKELKSKLASDATDLFIDLPRSGIPTSHFYIKKEYERFFYSLELNYFISKYYEQADRDGVMISIYAINYGLCKANNILFGRPDGDTKYRKYFISRHFDYNSVLEDYLLGHIEYECEICGCKYTYKEYDTLEKIDMLCYKGCKEKGKIVERKLFDKLNPFNPIERKNLLPEIELDILHTLSQNIDSNLYATVIAQELDCSYQLVGQRATKLQEKKLLDKEDKIVDGTSRKIYKITLKADSIYFKK